MTEQKAIKFTKPEADLIKKAFMEYEKYYGRFQPQERTDLINVKEALVHLHNTGILSIIEHKIYDGLVGHIIKKKGLHPISGKEVVVGTEHILGKLEQVAGKELKTVAEIEHAEEIETAKIAAEEKAKIKAEAMARVAEQEAKVAEEQAKLLEEKKAAHQAAKKNVITGDEEADIDIDDILNGL